MTEPEIAHLPRLLYVADTPVESSYHGSLLLYRLLETYPPDRLMVIEPKRHFSVKSRRLPDVRYEQTRSSVFDRGLHTRLNRLAVSLLAITSKRASSELRQLAARFEPDCILTVAYGYSWAAAGDLARRMDLPLHLVIHDDWPEMVQCYRSARELIARRFRRTYLQAHARYCVSPQMAQTYTDRYGEAAEVMYPSRSHGAISPPNPPEHLHDRHPLRVAFAGTVNGGGYVKTLQTLATQLEAQQGTLIIYGTMTEAAGKQAGLTNHNVEFRGLVPHDELVETLRQVADVMFVPMSFAEHDRVNMTLAFPSKLADCTRTGLPLLICGPSYCSAVRWGKDNPGVAEIVQSEVPQEMADALHRLSNPAYRLRLANTALAVGDRYFSATSVTDQFHRKLRGSVE